MEKIVLCIDFDDVIIPTEPLIQQVIEKIDYKAGNKYRDKLIKQKELGIIDDETFRELTLIHYERKDRVLEEIDDKYRDIINYASMYNTRNAYPNAINYINYLVNCGKYEVYIVSHYNVYRESIGKANFIHETFPNVSYIPVKYHMQPFCSNGLRRECTSKAVAVARELKAKGITSLFVLIDNSLSNVRDWKKNGGIGITINNNGILKYDELLDLNPMAIDILIKSETPKLYDGKESKKAK